MQSLIINPGMTMQPIQQPGMVGGYPQQQQGMVGGYPQQQQLGYSQGGLMPANYQVAPINR